MVDLGDILRLVLHGIVLHNFPLFGYIFDSRDGLVLDDGLFVGDVLDALLALDALPRLLDVGRLEVLPRRLGLAGLRLSGLLLPGV